MFGCVAAPVHLRGVPPALCTSALAVDVNVNVSVNNVIIKLCFKLTRRPGRMTSSSEPPQKLQFVADARLGLA